MIQTAEIASSPFDLKTREEAAALLRIHVSTLDRLTARGKIRPVRQGRRVQFEVDELARYVRSCRSA